MSAADRVELEARARRLVGRIPPAVRGSGVYFVRDFRKAHDKVAGLLGKPRTTAPTLLIAVQVLETFWQTEVAA